MNVQKWLGRGIGVKEELKSLQQQKAMEIARATRITSNLNGAVVSSSSDPHRKIEEPVIKYVDSLGKCEDKLNSIMTELNEQISLLDDSYERQVLRMYYLDGKTVEYISEYLDYSVSNIYRIKTIAERKIHDSLQDCK